MATSPRALRGSVCAALLVATACGGGSGGDGGDRPGGSAPATDLASVTPSPQAAARMRGPGEFAADYLRSTHFRRLEVEVDYPADRAPSPAALAVLRTRLEERCDKPLGIVFTLDDALPAGTFDGTTTPDEIAALEDRHRSTFSDRAAGVAAAYLLYVHGLSGEGTGEADVIGVAYRGGSCALYADVVDEGGSPPLVTLAEIEAAVLVHEFGHLLGLVNGGVPMVVPHEDPASPFHDVDPDCVMYFQLTVGVLAPNLADPGFAQFDPRCMEDLAAFGGRPAVPIAVPKPGSPEAEARGPRVTVGRCGCPACRSATARTFVASAR